MSWAQRAWDAYIEKKGLSVSFTVPLGVNPFRDLWNLLCKKSETNQKRRKKYERNNRISR